MTHVHQPFKADFDLSNKVNNTSLPSPSHSCVQVGHSGAVAKCNFVL